MADPVFTLAPNPHWVIIDNFSKLPAGAAIYTYRSLDPSQFKQAYQDAGGNVPYGQPITGFGNGTMPPIFWEFDADDPNETYYIRVYDSADTTTQQFLWDFDGLSGGGSGGGGNITTVIEVENLIVNGVFFRNIVSLAGTPSLPTSVTIAPSNFANLVNDPVNPMVVLNGPVGPDIIFAKSNITSSDSLSFIDFTPLGIQELSPDLTPQQYMRYSCTGAGAAETYKYVQFPISSGVQTTSGQTVSVRIYARCTAGNTTLTLRWRQFYGSGGAPSNDQFVVIGAIALTSDWAAYSFNSVVTPNASGNTLGSCNNDSLFLQVGYPLSPATTTIDIVKPEVFFGSIIPEVSYDSYDKIQSVVDSPRPGDVRISLNSSIFGWVIMNDGTIGNASSNATTRANRDTYPLFSLIWNLFSLNQTLAPMFTSGGAPIGYSPDPTTDFTLNRQISLTKEAGRVLAGVDGTHLIGTIGGANTHTLIRAELPDPVTATATTITAPVGAANTVIANNGPGGAGIINNIGGNQPFDVRQLTVYMNIFMKL